MHRRLITSVSALVAVLVSMPSAGSAGSGRAPETVERSGATSCTIRGTAHDDVLRGTPGRDVICGKGGDDTLVGLGGADVLIGGPGNDRLTGGSGNDRLDGGAGNDRVQGGAGNDRVVGGAGSDRLAGLSGADRLDGGASRDRIDGGTGEDDLLGGAGDDALDGGPQADDVDGGPGVNMCELDATDIGNRCAYDEAAPAADQIQFSTTDVDVTHAPAEITVRVHATDDTRVEDVIVSGNENPVLPSEALNLVSGSRRSGWWEGKLRFPRYLPPGSYVPQVKVIDRMRRASTQVFADRSFAVLDEDPDLDQPLASLITPLPTTTVDTRATGSAVKVRARLTDAKSGVAEISFWAVGPVEPSGSFSMQATYPRLISGNRRDGVWEGDITLDRNEVAGEWTIAILVTDAAHALDHSRIAYWGPGGPEHQGAIAGYPAVLPDGRGSFEVLGRTVTDVSAPTMSEAAISPATIDTLPGPASVTMTIRIRDNVRVDSATVWLLEEGESDVRGSFASGSLTLSRGTRRDGVWTSVLTVPQGTPPGRYRFWVWADDPELNSRTCVSSGFAGDASCFLDTDPVVTIVDSRTD